MSDATKIEAMHRLLQDHDGVASWQIIYDTIERYYPEAKRSDDWKAGLRGVLYRDMKNPDTAFKKLGIGIFALKDRQYEETSLATIKKDDERMHAHMEGVCIELGNLDEYHTFTADKAAQFNGVPLKNLVTLSELPPFTYGDILAEARNIDVIFFDKKDKPFPQRAYEVVDSIGTMENAISRLYQLEPFRTKFYILAPPQFKTKYDKVMGREPYASHYTRYDFIPYENFIAHYDAKKLEEERKTY